MDGMPEQEARIAAATQLTGINVPAIRVGDDRLAKCSPTPQPGLRCELQAGPSDSPSPLPRCSPQVR